MSIFGEGKKEVDLALEMGRLQGKLEQLERENEDLKGLCEKQSTRIERQMDTIIAIQHPESYQMLQDDRAIDDVSPLQEKDREKFMQDQRLLADLRDSSEGPLFKSADELMDIMKRSQGVPATEDQSLHGNSES